MLRLGIDEYMSPGGREAMRAYGEKVSRHGGNCEE